MRIIVGLGNPGKKYENTRHNIGWRVIDELAKDPETVTQNSRVIELKEDKKFSALVGRGRVNGDDILLVKPTTFMNLSGEAVKAIIDYYKVNLDDVWLVSDDLDLPVGWIRVRHQGRSGGHNGLQSVFDKLGTHEITRIRLGIGGLIEEGIEHPPEKQMPEAEIYVLQEFDEREKPVIDKAVEKAVQLIIEGIKARKLDSHTISIL